MMYANGIFFKFSSLTNGETLYTFLDHSLELEIFFSKT